MDYRRSITGYWKKFDHVSSPRVKFCALYLVDIPSLSNRRYLLSCFSPIRGLWFKAREAVEPIPLLSVQYP